MPATPSSRNLAALALALGASACAGAPSPSSPAQEPSPMTSTADATQASPPRLDAERSLRALLDLVRGARTVSDIDGARLRAAFGEDFRADGGRLGRNERLTADWWSSVELDPAANAGAPRLELAFRPEPADAHPPMTAICGMDYDAFAAELTGMGFAHRTYRGEHGRIISEMFERDGMTVQVHTRGEADAPAGKISHACVSMVLVA